MDKNTWARVKDLYERGRCMLPEERDAWLVQLATTEPEIAEEVRTLLLATADLPTVLDDTAEHALASFKSPEPDLFSPGDAIGPYVLIERVGSGGMGSVWRCTRKDGAAEEEYAIKFVRRGLDTATVLKRFALERATLASLRHPNIACLVDGGLTANDRPYLVMDFVHGQRIDHWCDARKLRTEERLTLFRVVCEAVHFAHKSLVVHRDLKPENILVTEHGVPILLDFGVAKVLDSGAGATVTQGTAGPLTPQYASPEQLHGESVSTASDVYSLGVILYDLLSGHLPYRLHGRGREELWGLIQESNFQKPSQVVTEVDAQKRGMRLEGLRRSLRGDVDTMVLKAMRFEPSRRYDSAGQMSEDLGRFLRGQPVLAQPDTLRYRFGKMVSRNKGVVSALIALIFVTVFSFYAIARQETIASEEARFAKGEAESLHRVVDLLIGLFESSRVDGLPPDALSARDLVDRGWMLLEEGGVMEPMVRSTLLLALGRVFTLLGELEKSNSLLEEGVALRRSLYEAPHPEIAEALAALGALRREQGRIKEAETALQEALDMWEATWGLDSLDAASTLNVMGLVMVDAGNLERAHHYFDLALKPRIRELGKNHSSVLSIQGNLAGLAFREGHLEEAEHLLRGILKKLDQSKQSPGLSIASNNNNLGLVLVEKGDLDAAESCFRKALALREHLLDPGHPEIAKTRNNLAFVLFKRGDYQAAAKLFGRAAEEAQSHLARNHPTVATLRLNQARSLLRASKSKEADSLLRDLLKEQRGLLPEGHPLLFKILQARALQLLDAGATRTALPLLEEALTYGDLENPPSSAELDLLRDALDEARRRLHLPKH